MMKDKTNKTDQPVEDGGQVTIEAKTRAEAVGMLNELREKASKKGLEAVGGFIVYDYEKEDIGGAPFSATVKFIDPKNI